jgi:hypothetical protein
MDYAAATTLFLIAFWIIVFASATRTLRHLKNAYEEQ